MTHMTIFNLTHLHPNLLSIENGELDQAWTTWLSLDCFRLYWTWSGWQLVEVCGEKESLDCESELKFRFLFATEILIYSKWI